MSLNQNGCYVQRKLFNYMILGVYALMAQIFTNLYFKVEIEYGRARLVDLGNFVAARPFQYRALVPATVHVIARLTHASEAQYFTLYQFIEIGCVFATLVAFRAYLGQFLSEGRAALLGGSIIVPMVLIHICCSSCFYPSDTPAILFFILGLIAIFKRAYPWLYLILAVSSVNRESSALLVVAFAAAMVGQISWRKYAAHLGGLSTVWLAIKLAINHIFARNAGMALEDHRAENHAMLGQLLHGNPTVVATTTFLSIIPTVLILGRKFIPSFLLRVLVVVPFYAAVMWEVGVFDEVRAWNEAVPAIMAPLIVLFCVLADRIASTDSQLLARDRVPAPP